MAEMPFMCTMCDLRTETEKEIKLHILEHHLGDHLTETWPDFGTKDSRENIESKSPSHIRKTKSVAGKKYPVSICSKRKMAISEPSIKPPKDAHDDLLINTPIINVPSFCRAEKRIKEADSDLFCPFARICSFDTNTIQKLKRHIDDLHTDFARLFCCIFPSCTFGTTHSLKQYSTHLRMTHADEVKNVLKSIREKRAKTEDIFVMQRYPSDKNNEDSNGTFIMMPTSESNLFQSVIKTTSKQIVQGAKDNGFITVSSTDLSSSQLQGTNENTNNIKVNNCNNDNKVIFKKCSINLGTKLDYYLSKNTHSESCAQKNLSGSSPAIVLNNKIIGDTLRAPEVDRKVIDVILEDIEDDISPAKQGSIDSYDFKKPTLETKINKMLKTVVQDSDDRMTEVEGVSAYTTEEAEVVSSLHTSSNQLFDVLTNANNQISMRNAKHKQNDSFPVLPLHQCKVCAKIVLSEAGLKRHINSVHNEVAFECTECEFSTRSRPQFKVHQKKHELTS